LGLSDISAIDGAKNLKFGVQLAHEEYNVKMLNRSKGGKLKENNMNKS